VKEKAVNVETIETVFVLKRSIVVAGHKTSVSLEDAFWKSLKEIAGQRDMTLAQLVATIDGNREHANLSSAIRLFVLGVYQDRTREARPSEIFDQAPLAGS
jgi:predicted DNA-binding ribbon-helix-helix protein